MLKDIQAVIFDLDGTLIDSMWVWTEIDVEFLGKRGIILPEDLTKKTEGLSFTEVAQYFKKTFKLEETIEEIKNEWLEMARDFYSNRIQLKPGAKELIEILKSKGIKMGIGTSCSRDLAEMVLLRHRIMKYFNTIVTSCEVSKGKPHPDVFLKVSEKLKTEPSSMLVFEDTVAGVYAAKAAGMKAVAVYDECSREFQDELREIADYYVNSINDFIKEGSKVG